MLSCHFIGSSVCVCLHETLYCVPKLLLYKSFLGEILLWDTNRQLDGQLDVKSGSTNTHNTGDNDNKGGGPMSSRTYPAGQEWE